MVPDDCGKGIVKEDDFDGESVLCSILQEEEGLLLRSLRFKLR
jgi:hypothetical protein